MKFKVLDAQAMVSIIKTIAEFMDEANIISSKDGIKISGIDPSRVTFLDFFLPSSYFENYESKEKEVIGINLKDLTTILSRVMKNDSLSMEAEDKLKVRLEGDFERIFVLPLLNIEEQKNPSLNLEFPFKARMATSFFSDIISGLEDLGDTLTVYSEDGKLYFSVEGDMGESKVELSTDNGALFEASGSNAKSTYGMEYVANTTKMLKASDTVEIAFGSQIPLKLHFELPQGGYGDFYIAPRVE
ncbi:DNA polymerase sliding clamp [Acidianus sulfidivorans JP7]|uniref:DNA polymerase sliding clamp n=1 Tax=Acidianus sulfidivorans JP7 TaxID=619593 RepID=A0A2U9INL5_9CREN|nr:DNA polymerase sliding clamp [Acidianus sulfidivorans]AWR97669.1 DNA polymerase sliding clamp [Acidianus sulfidivorans JP7]